MVHVTVPSVSTSDDNSHTLYHVLVKTDTQQYVLKKRYTDFVSLKQELESLYSDQMPYIFPKKTYLRKTTKDERLAEERRLQLEKFLNDVIRDSLNIKWKKSLPFREFLSLPPGAFSSVNQSTKEKVNSAWTLSSTTKNEPIVDLTEWISAIRESKKALENSRSKMFVEPGEARKGLILGRAKFEGLSKGLEIINKEQLIAEGELKRRQELLHSLKREHDNLESLLANVTSRGLKVNEDEEGKSFSRTQLFKGRVIGKPRETERTRGQDNQELLQMQRQDFKQQDKELDQLRVTINRQKELAIAINEELAIQNELLDELDTEVDSTTAKLQYASTKIGRLT